MLLQLLNVSSNLSEKVQIKNSKNTCKKALVDRISYLRYFYCFVQKESASCYLIAPYKFKKASFELKLKTPYFIEKF